MTQGSISQRKEERSKDWAPRCPQRQTQLKESAEEKQQQRWRGRINQEPNDYSVLNTQELHLFLSSRKSPKVQYPLENIL